MSVTFNAAFRCSQLIRSKNKCLGFDWRDWDCNMTSAVMLCILAFCYFIAQDKYSINMHTCWPETSHSCHGRDLFIRRAKIQGAKMLAPTPIAVVFFLRDSGIIAPWCRSSRGDTRALTRKPWWGWWRRWARGIDPQCAHCAERQKDLLQRRTHGNQLGTSLIVA